MTWVIGANTPFGYGILVSDIRATWPNSGREVDLVQKSHAVAPNVAAGFSGKIVNGYVLLDHLSRLLVQPDPQGLILRDYGWIYREWPRTARRVWARDPQIVHGLRDQTSILMVISRLQSANEPQTLRPVVGMITRSPDFRPEIFRAGNAVYSIGSGNNFQEYTDRLAEIQNSPEQIFRVEIGPVGFGRSGQTIAIELDTMLRLNPRPGISHHTHHWIVGPNGVGMANSDAEQYPGEGQPTIIQRMPDVATRLGEFMRMAQGYGGAAEAIG